MIADIVLTDDDQGREYHLTVTFRCRPEIGAAPGWCVDIELVQIEEAVAYFDKQGSEIRFAEYGDRIAAAGWVLRKYPREIESLCLAKYLAEKAEAT